jgi:hypothetical protein
LKSAAATGGTLILGRARLTFTDGLGPSTVGPSYVLPSLEGVDITPILTVGEAADNSYRFVGVPDGLGALNHGSTFSLYGHHELTRSAGGSGPGIVRARGSSGAFVSAWTIDKKTLGVLEGRDLTPSAQDVYLWDPVLSQYYQGTMAWNRLCSADLPVEKAFRHGNHGTSERLFLGGEEVDFGRAWARIVTGSNAGQAWELPRLGKQSWENVVACPHGKDRTIVAH